MTQTRAAALACALFLVVSACGGEGGEGTKEEGEAEPAASSTGGSGAAVSGSPEELSYASELDVHLDSMTRRENGLYVQVLQEGDGATASSDDTVTVHYTGWLADGRKFDSSRDRGEPATFPLSGVIPGWREGVADMRVGEVRRLVIPPELGYGSRGTGPIPPDATLVFEVELLGVN